MAFYAAAFVTVFAQAAAPPPADEDPARLVDRGVELRLAGDDERAIELLRRAEKIRPSPRGRAQLGFAEQSLGLWREAEAHLLRALDHPSDPWIAKNAAAIGSALRTIGQHLGSLEVRGGEGAEVLLDGASLGSLPSASPWRVEVGAHRLEVRAAGYYPVSRAIEITPGGHARETISLRPVTTAPATATTVGSVAMPSPSSVGSPADASPRSSTWPRTLGWGFVGASALGAGFGVASILVSNGRADDYNDNPACARAGEPESCVADASAQRTWRTVSIASFVASGALAIGGVVLLVVSPSKTTSVSLGVMPNGFELTRRW